jgi:ABC-type antimicrobial peptide transport system permease subunit
VPLTQTDAASAQLIFEHRGDAVAAHVALRHALTSTDPLLVAAPVQTLDEVIDKLALVARSVTKLFVFCFGFALLLAVSGTYGLMARSIGQRTREIGVRRALGATNASITQLLLGQGGRQLGVGAVVALPVMLLVGVGFSHYFPIALALSVTICALVSLTIVGVVLAATYLPTRKVLSVEVREALWRD